MIILIIPKRGSEIDLECRFLKNKNSCTNCTTVVPKIILTKNVYF